MVLYNLVKNLEKTMKKRLAVGFTGPSNSGKTSLIVKIARKLLHKEGLEVAIIKHDPKDKAWFDVEGKDSYKFYDTGAEVIVTSPTRTTYFSNRHKDLDEMVRLFGNFDILLVEGLKNLPLPKIGIFRNELDSEYFDYMKAIAIDHTIDKTQIPNDLDILDLNNIDEVIEWIFKNAKEI
jgi:molybdopterin-guanine dinucleotide biosynthesis protein B